MSSEHAPSHPSWWTDSHESGWERVREALRRDWEQTKLDFGARGRDLNQGVVDTVRQALGKEPLPPPSVPKPGDARQAAWEEVEPPMRFGYDARQKYRERSEWDEELELQLRREWEGLAPTRLWSDVRQFVHRGWMGP